MSSNIAIASEPFKRKVSIPEFRKRILPNNFWWMTLIGLFIAIAFAQIGYSGATDNDQWWLFATGREILDNGIPHTNPFAVFDDMNIVVQQWLPSVVAYLCWNAGGALGIGVLVFVMTLLLYASCMLLAYISSEGKHIEIYSVLAGFVVAGCLAYISIRPHLYSMIAFVLVLCVMEKYRRSGGWKTLLFLPLIALVHANCHLSMMPFDLFIVACYVIPVPVLRQHFSHAAYKRIPVVIAMVAMAGCSLINPYGLDGILYLVNSYGAASYRDYIVELGHTTVWCWYGFYAMFWAIIGAIAIGSNGIRKIDLPLTVFFLVCLVLSLQHTRNVWLVTLAAYVLAAGALGNVSAGFKKYHPLLEDDPVKIAVMALGCFLITGLTLTSTEELSQPLEDATRTPTVAVSYLDSHVEDKDSAKIFTHFNAGGYLEYCGYNVGMDARPELWQSKITGLDKDYYTEYVDMSKGDLGIYEYLDGKGFDYLIVNTDTNMYKTLKHDENYEIVVNGNEYVMFQPKSDPGLPSDADAFGSELTEVAFNAVGETARGGEVAPAAA